ncbi:MAG: hypothetical protein ACLR8Y_13780 [Alistipes indistinctus]
MGLLATHAKERKSGKAVFYNRNFHIEPTNVCVFNCRFCSYRRPADSPDAWDYSKEEILAQVDSHRGSGADRKSTSSEGYTRATDSIITST